MTPTHVNRRHARRLHDWQLKQKGRSQRQTAEAYVADPKKLTTWALGSTLCDDNDRDSIRR
jgi:hypothetical protein